MASTIDLSKLPPQTFDFSQIWLFIKVGVHKLMDFPENVSATEYMNLSAIVYNLTMRSRTCALDFQKNLMEIFMERVQLTAKQAAKMVDVDLLRYYVTEFHGYKTCVERVDRVFAFYNRRWTMKVEEGSANVLPVISLGLTLWKENCALVLQRDGKKITSAILRLIMNERNGEKVEEDLVKNVIDSFIALDIDHQSTDGFYQEEFEAPFLQATTDYHYKQLEQDFQAETFISDYLNGVEEKLLDEERRAKRYLPQKTHNKVVRTLLISEHCGVLAQMLLLTGDDERLRRMYTLLSRIKPDGLGPLKTSFELHVKKELEEALGDTSVTDKQDPSVDLRLSDIQHRHQEIVKTCFQGDEYLAAVLGEGERKVKKGIKKGRKGKA